MGLKEKLSGKLSSFDFGKVATKPFLDIAEDVKEIVNGRDRVRSLAHLIFTGSVMTVGAGLPFAIPSYGAWLAGFSSAFGLPEWIGSYIGSVYISTWGTGYLSSFAFKQMLRGVTNCIWDDPDYFLTKMEVNRIAKKLYSRLKEIDGLENLTMDDCKILTRDFHDWIVEKIRDKGEKKLYDSARLTRARNKLLKGNIDSNMISIYKEMKLENQEENQEIVAILKAVTCCDENPEKLVIDLKSLNEEKEINLAKIRKNKEEFEQKLNQTQNEIRDLVSNFIFMQQDNEKLLDENLAKLNDEKQKILDLICEKIKNFESITQTQVNDKFIDGIYSNLIEKFQYPTSKKNLKHHTPINNVINNDHGLNEFESNKSEVVIDIPELESREQINREQITIDIREDNKSKQSENIQQNNNKGWLNSCPGSGLLSLFSMKTKSTNTNLEAVVKQPTNSNANSDASSTQSTLMPT